jgi:tetratricopeptide (TPR) repeat protein
VLRHPSSVDQQSLRQLERTTVALQRQEGELNPEALLPAVRAHLQDVTELLRYGSFGSRTRQWLCSIAGEIASLAGWLMWELDDGNGATAYFRSGIQAASEAGDRALGAYLVGCFACQPLYRERPEARLRHLCQRTFGFAQTDAAPATRAWLAVLEAEANALLGRAGDCFKALNRAEAIASQNVHREQSGRPAIPSSHGAFFSDAYLAADEGVARLKLRRAAEAIDILEPLLASLDSNRLKNWYWLYPILADAYIDEGHIERACHLASEALRGSFQARIMTNLPLITKLQGKLVPYRDYQAVRHLGEELETVKSMHPGVE